MKLKKKPVMVGLVVVVLVFLLSSSFFVTFNNSQASNQPATAAINEGDISSIITASGDVEAQNQASLAFLTVGRVASVGVKEGDQVSKGEVLATLDSTVASYNVAAAQAQYRSAQSALNKVLDDIHLSQYGNGGFANVGSANETQTQKNDRQLAEEAVNTAYDNLQSAQKQLDLQSIVAPFNGKVLSIQNISEGANVSLTSGGTITVVGGGELKFVANVLQQDIDQVHIGQTVAIKLDSKKDHSFPGTVTNIADGKTMLSDGRNVIKVDIQSNDLQSSAQAGQSGNIEININQTGVTTVPSWLVLADKYIWVDSNGQTLLREVTVGNTVDGKTSISSGLEPSDRVILNPEIIAKNKYKLL